MREIAINARFTMRRATGVERYAREVSARLGERAHFIKPSHAANGIPGHLWEQIVLPQRVGNRVLWSPCNSGPVAVRRQVLTIHDCAVLDHPEWFSNSFATLYASLLPKLAARAAAIITVSNHAKSRLIERLRVADKKISVIQNGVGPQFRRTGAHEIVAARTKLAIPTGPYVLSVCSTEPRKNLTTLLEAWRLAAAQRPDLTLVLVGGAGKKSIFRSAKIASQAPNILFTGYVEDALLPALYSGTSCFVYPSLYEGFGLPVLEDLACGAPVVTSNCTALPEIAGPSRLIDPHSASEIASAVIGTASAPQTKDTAEAAMAFAGGHTWDRCASETESVLNAAA